MLAASDYNAEGVLPKKQLRICNYCPIQKMKRVEYKITDVNRPWLEDVLYKHGFEKTFEGEMSDIYYDRNQDGFLKKGKRVTLRTKGSLSKLSFRDKYNDLGLGIVDEWEVEVSDGEMMDQIMLGLGFNHFRVFKKYRYDYAKEGMIISFDKYTGDLSYIPEFMMLEGNSEEEIFEWAEKFGYTNDDCQAISVLDLIEMYKKKHDLALFG